MSSTLKYGFVLAGTLLESRNMDAGHTPKRDGHPVPHFAFPAISATHRKEANRRWIPFHNGFERFTMASPHLRSKRRWDRTCTWPRSLISHRRENRQRRIITMAVTISGSGYQLADDPSTPRTDATVPFRDIIPRPDHPRIKGIESHDAHTWCTSRKQVPEPAWLINRLELANLERPYKGFSADGNPNPDVWMYGEDEGAPVEAAVEAAEKFLDGISAKDRKEVVKGDVETDDEFRAWSNPELYVNPGTPFPQDGSICANLFTGGIRLDETDSKTQGLIHDILKASLSPAGYEKANGCTLTNAFLGQLINGQAVLNEHSYNFRLFGKPSLTAPWGFSFFGHHLCLQVVFVGKRMVIGPTFMGAEPDRIDEGPHAGLRLFSQEEVRGLNLMRDLSEENQKRAQLNEDMVKGLAEDRWNPFDER